jgi:hypothetical protein
MTSPIPAETREGQRVRAGGDPEACHLGETARDQPGLAVVAEAEPIRCTGRDRDDVLQGAAELDPEQVPVDVQPELTPPDALDDPVGEHRVLRGDDRGRRQAAGNLAG